MSELFEVSAKPLLAAFGYHINHSPHIFIESILLCESPCVFQQCSALAIELLVCLKYFFLLLLTQTCSFHTSFINAPHPWWVMTADYEKRRDILINTGK